LDASSGLPDCNPEDRSSCYVNRSDPLAPSWRNPEAFRTKLLVVEGGYWPDGSVNDLALPDYGLPNAEHTVYIRFVSGTSGSDEDDRIDSPIDAAVIVDDIEIYDGQLAYAEDFEGAISSNVQFVNAARTKPFGEWARLCTHVTDNQPCVDNMTKAWLFSHPLDIAIYSDMAFGPGAAVVRKWLDDVIISPWVQVPRLGRQSAVLSFREFPGQRFTQSKIARGFSLRGTSHGDTCITNWKGDAGYESAWNSPWQGMDSFNWVTRVNDASPFFEASWDSVRVRIRVSDWQWIAGAYPPVTLNPGPGPYIDRVRLGLLDVSPIIYPGPDTRWQAQDAFPTVQNDALGEHFSPDGANRYGTCAFSMVQDLGIPRPPAEAGSYRVLTGDSIVVQVGGSTSHRVRKVAFCYRIVQGPHENRMPPITMTVIDDPTIPPCQYSEVLTDSILRCELDFGNGYEDTHIFAVDFDDTYFMGGDVLQYF
jgi:hypothetical protein